MNLSLGIDTGGTYTDAVLVNHDTGEVLAGAKALTTRHDLSRGISGAIEAVFASQPARDAALTPSDVTLVALSTTLATNTLAEGQRGAVCLILIGYERELMAQWGFDRQMTTDDVVHIAGGHDERGGDVAPLDEAAARAAIIARKDTVEAFAISGYFSVRNPAHELRVRALVAELTGLPVTCGHELTSKLNAVRRATTVALNAHLILPLAELIASVRTTLDAWAIAAPLMVVKGDGSLVQADWAMQRPIETILSGPAASAVGAWHLAGRRDVWAVDVGGTTTDIARLHDGAPILNPEGATVGGWQTMVEAVDVHTTGLGGDSYVRLDDELKLLIGPRRVVPLSLLASEWPEVVAELRREVAIPPAKRPPGVGAFVVAGRQAGARLSEAEEETLRTLAEGPLALAALAEQRRSGALARRQIESLEARGLARRAAFTPTDALHVLGRYVRWDAEAARLGAELLAGAGRRVGRGVLRAGRGRRGAHGRHRGHPQGAGRRGGPLSLASGAGHASLPAAGDGRRRWRRARLRADPQAAAGGDRCAGRSVHAGSGSAAEHRACHPAARRGGECGRRGVGQRGGAPARADQPAGR